ncbi:MAG: hypothetical protein NTX98_00135 [Candidatus Doudnabacteria bacterium]|nr:hypothetical protein [Candidatus Doudnabacteria bacterium]
MLETKEQKQYFTTAVVLIVVLSLVSLWHRQGPQPVENRQNQAKNNEQFNAQAYLKYLETLKIDPKASKELFQQLITKEEIKEQVEKELGADQPIKTPKVSDSQIKISTKTGSEAIMDYFANTTGIALNFNAKTKNLSQELFSENQEAPSKILPEYEKAYKQLLAVEAPKEAAALHKDLVSSFISYGVFLEVSKNFAQDSSKDVWPEVYRNYAAINEVMGSYGQELNKIAEKYKLADAPILPYYAGADSNDQFRLIKTAHAFLGIGDVTITVGDIPRIIMDAIQEGLASSFSKFMGSYIEKFVAKIESNYMIANFLYYSDALVSGQYVNDYLNKYVADSLDRQIVKKMIPQFNCGKQDPNLKKVFEAKASEYLGFNPEEVSPNDPQYYEKMARVGSMFSRPDGFAWESIYEGMAQQAKSEAEKAAEKELTSPGLKTPRDTINKSINLSVNSIVSSERAALSSLMQLGSSNAKSFISSFVARLTENLMNKFVFRGAVANGSSVGVLKEQPTCLAATQLSVVVPSSVTQYETPLSPPSEDDLLLQQCERFPDACKPQVRGPVDGQ